jgi:hypothetical protein
VADYPPEAYAPDGRLWWELDYWPGTRRDFGVERKLAAWLTFNARIGQVLTIRQLRAALGGAAPNTDEHFNRRLRALRPAGYEIPSGRDVGGLRPDEYRLDAIGSQVWLPGSRASQRGPSARVRRYVFDRDGHRCVVCGLGAGEPYPGEPGSTARMTLGHVLAGSLAGETDPNNLRTECSRCNEPVRDEARTSESIDALAPRLRSLRLADKEKLLTWIRRGARTRDNVDELYDAIRVMPADQRDQARALLERAGGRSSRR